MYTDSSESEQNQPKCGPVEVHGTGKLLDSHESEWIWVFKNQAMSIDCEAEG